MQLAEHPERDYPLRALARSLCGRGDAARIAALPAGVSVVPVA